MRAVFLVESTSPLLKLLGWALIEEGFKVSRSTELNDALTRLPGTSVSAVIINAELSAEGLRDYVSAVHVATPGTPVIALISAAAADQNSGAEAHLAPPYSIDELVRLMSGLA